MHRVKVKVVADALDANATIAAANRADFDRTGVKVINLMSAPGAGKTSVLERILPLDGVRVGVLEGDVQGSLDADRLAHRHIPVMQLNTDPGFGGECHLDANMVRSALPAVPLAELDVLIIENVGALEQLASWLKVFAASDELVGLRGRVCRAKTDGTADRD